MSSRSAPVAAPPTAPAPPDGVDVLGSSPRLVAKWHNGPPVADVVIATHDQKTKDLGIVVENHDANEQSVEVTVLVEDGTGKPQASHLAAMTLGGGATTVVPLDLQSLPNQPGTDYSGSLMAVARGKTTDGRIHETVAATLFWHATGPGTYAVYGEAALAEVFNGGDGKGQHTETIAALAAEGIVVSRVSFGADAATLSEEGNP